MFCEGFLTTIFSKKSVQSSFACY